MTPEQQKRVEAKLFTKTSAPQVPDLKFDYPLPLSKYPHLMIDQCFHKACQAVMQSNNWEYAYSLGYVSGKYDVYAKRKREHSLDERDEYALGYHRGYSEKD